ncbi:MAG: cyclase [Chloroflexi bacterium]|nr:cyclase [Chloroflexota bacterium]MDA1146295.1 cyclase [Chloroflexota bacterium]
MRVRGVALAGGLAAVGTLWAAVARRSRGGDGADDEDRSGNGPPSFRSHFTVRAPLEVVARFHADPRALLRLTPPPTIIRVHRMDPLAEGSVSDFTMWVGPPIHWRAVHSDLGPNGFTDTQERGPMARWVHRHYYRALAPDRTEVTDEIWYAHPAGWRGLLTRLLFSTIPLRGLFAYRSWVTRRTLDSRRDSSLEWHASE